MNGTLFSQDFLLEGITQTPLWALTASDDFHAFTDRLRTLYTCVRTDLTMNEADTEADLIHPTLEVLGFAALLRQQSSGRGRSDVPDALLFADADAKDAARKLKRDEERYALGLSFLESKRWGRPLDRADPGELDATTPSAQMLRYLSRVEAVSDRRIQWGILSNGRHWRLYWQGARARAEQFCEIDLGWLLEVPGTMAELHVARSEDRAHWLKVFWLLFRREAFLPQPEDVEGRSFHRIALDEGRYWESKIAEDLGEQVFGDLFPQLTTALALADAQAPQSLHEAYLQELRDAALIYLYRLLFLLYAEDRDLLPVRDARYGAYALRRLREEVADKLDHATVLSARQTRYAQSIANLCAAVDQGDESLGVPPYNGGLFDARAQPLLTRALLSDAALAPILDGLSRRRPDVAGEARRWINYRDLSVRHLGSLYERLLEFTLVEHAGAIAVRPSVFARKVSGSYYTHDDLVDLVIAKTLEPLVDERKARFTDAVTHWGAQRERHEGDEPDHRLRELREHDPATALLELKICDPAMGSGHFLVAVVDWLADEVLLALAEAPVLVTFAKPERPYRSPLATRIANLRAEILTNAARHHWTVRAEQLDDRQIVRRMILKKVIHGVDKNPMAVELAKLALWLHTFTVGAPLSFLDHHLRCGDSLFGERVAQVLDDLDQSYGRLLLDREMSRIGHATESMAEIGELTDVAIAEVRQSHSLFEEMERDLKPLRRFLSFWHALRWLHPQALRPRKSGDKRGKAPSDPVLRGMGELMGGQFGDVYSLLERGGVAVDDPARFASAQVVDALLRAARNLAAEQNFLSWELAFPTVWRGLDRHRLSGGFDAIVGNPPWDRIKLQQVEWFAARDPAIAHQSRAADRKRMIAALERANAPLAAQYLRAAEAAENATRVARTCGEYPLMSAGDLNLYALFVERAARLVAPDGVVGLLTPSGVAADLSTSAFFKSIATSGRLGHLYDFENRKVFFPDVHASFKFCALVFGGEERRYPACQAAFYLHATADLEQPERSFQMSADDFAAVNPNTGTAPIFRRRADATLTTRLYRQWPVLVRHTLQGEQKLYPVRYTRMFDMTNDSGLFIKATELQAQGWYAPRGWGQRRKRGDEEAVPLYVGKMIRHYNHRAAGVTVNEENLHVAASSDDSTVAELQDPDFAPTPQYWINTASDERLANGGWRLAFRDIARGTDVRTFIASIVPSAACGNTLPLMLPEGEEGASSYALWAPVLLANLNSFALDFIARQKAQSTHLNWYIVEQLPLIPPGRYAQWWSGKPEPQTLLLQREPGEHGLQTFIRGEVLRLSYTAHDLAPFARSQGYTGAPFAWDEEDRAQRMARLDALYFQLYGYTREEVADVLEQFPIVREQDERAHGRYRTCALILAYFNAVAAGDLETVIDA